MQIVELENGLLFFGGRKNLVKTDVFDNPFEAKTTENVNKVAKTREDLGPKGTAIKKLFECWGLCSGVRTIGKQSLT